MEVGRYLSRNVAIRYTFDTKQGKIKPLGIIYLFYSYYSFRIITH